MAPTTKPVDTGHPPILVENIPQELKALRQWVPWREVMRDGRMTKPPFRLDGSPGDSTNPDAWASFQDALRASQQGSHGFQGIGFTFSVYDPYAGVDLDHCRDPQTGEIAAWAWEIIHALNSYTEISPSGEGVHIIVKGRLLGERNRTGNIEVYDQARYFTFTGHRVEGTGASIERCQGELTAFYNATFPGETKPALAPQPFSLDDATLLQKAFAASNGTAVRRLFEGDMSAYPSHSEADAALAAHLWYWSGGDPEQVKRLLLQSGLARDKMERADYLERTIKLVADGPVFSHNERGNGDGSSYASPTGTQKADPRWPGAMQHEAFYGLAGDVVRALDPHTEADPAAILVSFLEAFGNAIGRGPHTCAEADRHGANIFAVLVGETAKGRKGTSWGQIEALFQRVTIEGASTRIQRGGLSSGEGLIWAVRDAIEKPVRDKGTGESRMEVVDEGVWDKRFLVVESEFASVLRVQSREGNTLSPLLRQAWDTGALSTLVKNSPARATGAHISIIGHITREELLRHLGDTEAANGYANRFLWVCVKRSKVLPEGGGVPDLRTILPRLQSALENGRQEQSYARDDEARRAWAAVYPSLSEGKAGLFGAVVGRGEAQVLRLSLIYALLDESPVIRVPHLAAALAVWQYVEESAKCIFGDATGDPVADRIMDALRVSPDGLDRTHLINVTFGKNFNANRIGRALMLLLTLRRARRGTVTPTATPENPEGRGRPREVWYAEG